MHQCSMVLLPRGHDRAVVDELSRHLVFRLYAVLPRAIAGR
jgi:hypothetical protein